MVKLLRLRTKTADLAVFNMISLFFVICHVSDQDTMAIDTIQGFFYYLAHQSATLANDQKWP